MANMAYSPTRSIWKNRTAVAAALAVTLAVAGCSAATTSPTAAATTAPETTLTVLAAASLTDAFPKLGVEFQNAHPGTTVKFSYGGSSALAQQIVQGAPADVFAAASPATMKTVSDADVDGTPQNFVSNQLVIAVPCGAAADKALAAANVTLTPVSLESDVKAALSKVELGEADAALVYRTDVKSSDGKVQGVEFPESAKAINEYPIAALKNSKNLDMARQFVAFMLTPAVLTELEGAGFQAPQ
jgi:molybdate transport system substrate-binding protein